MTKQAAPLYKVLRSRKMPHTSRYYTVTTVEAAGLRWEDAKALSERLQSEEAEAKPLQTSWTYDIFFCEREDIAVSQVGKKLRVTRRKKRTTATAPNKQRVRAVQLAIQW